MSSGGQGEAGGAADRSAPSRRGGPPAPCVGEVVGPAWRASRNGGGGGGEVVGGGSRGGGAARPGAGRRQHRG